MHVSVCMFGVHLNVCGHHTCVLLCGGWRMALSAIFFITVDFIHCNRVSLELRAQWYGWSCSKGPLSSLAKLWDHRQAPHVGVEASTLLTESSPGPSFVFVYTKSWHLPIEIVSVLFQCVCLFFFLTSCLGLNSRCNNRNSQLVPISGVMFQSFTTEYISFGVLLC